MHSGNAKVATYVYRDQAQILLLTEQWDINLHRVHSLLQEISLRLYADLALTTLHQVRPLVLHALPVLFVTQ